MRPPFRSFVKHIPKPAPSISEYGFWESWYISIFSNPNRAILVGFSTNDNETTLYLSKYLLNLNLSFFVGNIPLYFPESSLTPLQLLTHTETDLEPYMIICNGKFLPFNDLLELQSLAEIEHVPLRFIPSLIIFKNQLIILNILMFGFKNLKQVIKYGNPPSTCT